MAKIEKLSDDALDEVAGGHFNWWKDGDTRLCWVNDVGTFVCSVDAKDTFAWLKAQHMNDGWSEADYANALLATGDFTPYQP